MALADGGAHYGLICDASFPTYFLQRWSAMPIPATGSRLRRRHCRADRARPAATVGMTDRGRIAEGMKATSTSSISTRCRMFRRSVTICPRAERMHQAADGYKRDRSYQRGHRCRDVVMALPGRLVRRGGAWRRPARAIRRDPACRLGSA